MVVAGTEAGAGSQVVFELAEVGSLVEVEFSPGTAAVELAVLGRTAGGCCRIAGGDCWLFKLSPKPVGSNLGVAEE